MTPGPSLPSPADVLNSAPDDSLETRAIKRQGWALYLGLTLAFFSVTSAIGFVLFVQSAEASACETLITSLREEWTASQALILAQVNDRLDAQAGDLMRCRDANERLYNDMRALESEWREKLERMSDD
jgi:hypothetical protein